MTQQAEVHGAVIRTFAPVESIKVEPSGHFVLASEGEEFEADCVIVATGAVPRKLGIPGEAEFTGRGVSWCATCDGALFKEKVVAVVGGGDAAVEEAMFLTKFASRVHLIHRRDEFRATKCIQERCRVNPKIEEHLSRIPVEVVGEDGKVAGLRLESTNGEPEEFLPVQGVFIFVGVHPVSELVNELVKPDRQRVHHHRPRWSHLGTGALRRWRRHRLRAQAGHHRSGQGCLGGVRSVAVHRRDRDVRDLADRHSGGRSRWRI